MRNILFNRRSSKLGLLGSLVAVLVVALVLTILPQKENTNTRAETCDNAPTTPTLNYWPVTYDDDNTPFCHDFPAIDAGARNPNGPVVFSQSEADWNNGLTLSSGEEAVALMYIHNGAANNLPQDQTTARNVKIETRTDTNVGSTHQISVKFYGDNTNTVNKSFTIHTPSNAKLQVIANTGAMYDVNGTPIGQSNLNLGNSTFNLGDLNACFEYSLFLSFKFKVVTETSSEDTTLSIDKVVKNLTTGSGYSSSVDAETGDRVGYQIKVRNNGPAIARGVTVSDNGASGISVDSGSTVISNNLHQGTIPGTINIGDMQPNTEVTITYTGRVTEDDCMSLTNTARANAANASQVSDSATVRVTDCGGNDRDIDIEKKVKNLSTGGSYSETVNARPGERAGFKVTVTNTGDSTVNNVIMTDVIPSGLQFDDSVSGDGHPSFSGRTFKVDFGSIRAGDSKTVEFAVKVIEDDSTTICNTAKADGDNVDEVSDDACVKIVVTSKPGEPNISISKKAWNDTKGVDATSTHADRGNYITFTLTTTNHGTADAVNYVIRDDLSGVLPLADLVDSNGGTLNGNVLTYPSVTIKPGQTVTKTFKVQVKTSLAPTLSYQIKNTYGNTVIINIPGKVVFEAPKTGVATTSAGIFAGLVTAAFVAVRRGKDIMKFIFA